MPTKAEIMAELRELGASFSPLATKAVLTGILEEAKQQDEAPEETPEETPASRSDGDLTVPISTLFPKRRKGLVGYEFDCPNCDEVDTPQSSHSTLCIKCTGDDQTIALDTTKRYLVG